MAGEKDPQSAWLERVARKAKNHAIQIAKESFYKLYRSGEEKALSEAGEEAEEDAIAARVALESEIEARRKDLEEADARIAEVQRRCDSFSSLYSGANDHVEELAKKLQSAEIERDRETARADAWREAARALIDEYNEIYEGELWDKAERLQEAHDVSAHGVARRPDG